MAQAIDMRRLHMGCGESLQSHLPLPVYGKRRQLVSPRMVIERHGARMAGDRKKPPEASR